MMTIIANSDLYNPREYGRVAQGEYLTVRDSLARELIANRNASPLFYETKVIRPETKSAQPFVTCIMPTADRRQYLPCAIRSFLRQTYAAKELLILDDGTDPVADLIPQSPDIRYVRVEKKAPIGCKRNELCSQAFGELIAHWDDDDWSCPTRLAEQVQVLLENPEVGITGYRSVLFIDERTGKAHRYLGRPNYAVGTSLMYRRSYWADHQFPGLQVGEDTAFVTQAAPGVVYAVDAEKRMVARIHKGSTAPKLGGREWEKVDVSEIPEIE